MPYEYYTLVGVRGAAIRKTERARFGASALRCAALLLLLLLCCVSAPPAVSPPPANHPLTTTPPQL